MSRKKVIIIIIMTAGLFLFFTIYLCIYIFNGYQNRNQPQNDAMVESEVEGYVGEIVQDSGQTDDIKSIEETETDISKVNEEVETSNKEIVETEEIEYKPISAFTVGDAMPAESTAPSVCGISNNISFRGMNELDKILPIEAQYHIVADTQKFLEDNSIQGKVLTPDNKQTVQRENEIIYVCTVDNGELIATKYIITDDIFEFSMNVEEFLAEETEVVTAETVNADN